MKCLSSKLQLKQSLGDEDPYSSNTNEKIIKVCVIISKNIALEMSRFKTKQRKHSRLLQSEVKFDF